MKPFLYSVAEAYFNNEADKLGNFCFVFPNKRSVTFFNHYLSEIIKRHTTDGCSPLIMPHSTTITDFTESFSDGFASADRMEMIFILYDVYKEIVSGINGGTEAVKVDFNKFVYWADTLIQDIDDVDNALADPYQIFRNVSTLKEISANYFTKEQAKIVSEFWKDYEINPEVKEFWNHISYSRASGGKPIRYDDKSPHTSARAGFLKLWQVMGDLYMGFRNRLKTMGLHTPGMNARSAAEKLKEIKSTELPYHRYIFVGFNNLSVAEKTIFNMLSLRINTSDGISMADFYWDLGSPVFFDKSLPGIGKVIAYANKYTSRYECVEKITTFPDINVIGIPSRIGQCKAICTALGNIYPDDPNPVRLRRTAIVLPEESLLTPLVGSLPQQISPLNITMGYKLKNTAVAGLMRLIVSLQMRAYKSKVAKTFFYEDVLRVLTNPLVRAINRNIVDRMLTEIRSRRLFNIPENFFRREEFSLFAPIFTMVADKQNCDDVFKYLRHLLEWLDEALVTTWNIDSLSGKRSSDPEDSYIEEELQQPDDAAIQPASSDTDRSLALQQAYIRRYTNAVIQLQKLREQYLENPDGTLRVFLEDATVFNLVERIIKGEMLNFDGIPLRGLQIMGVLEARALDFETIIIPSMNERIFPRSKFGATFIPMVLRRAYHLNTNEDQENAYVYFFYRMISRAKNVHLLYDARTSGLKSSQPSRFIHQLRRIIIPDKLNFKILPYRLSTIAVPDVYVRKTPEIMQRINRFRNLDNPLYLSATSIERYLGCPVAFYLENIAGFRQGEEMNDWIDEGTYGVIVHEVFETLYDNELKLRGNDDGVPITAENLEQMAQNDIALDKIITRTINKHFTRIGDDNDTPLVGDSMIIGRIMKMLVQATLRREKDHAPFIYHFGEWDKRLHLTLKGSDNKSIDINFTCKIDRIDTVDINGTFPHRRIVDYKTGGDQTKARSVPAVFSDYKVKAFLQLMLYCQAYASYTGYHDAIQPIIFPIRTIMIRKLDPLQWSEPEDSNDLEHLELKKPSGRSTRWNVLDYRDYKEEFNNHLIAALQELFDPDIPFRCPDSNDACKYCNFLEICRREIPR